MKDRQKKQGTQIKMNKSPRNRMKWYGDTCRQNEDRILKKTLIQKYMDVLSCSTWSYSVTSGYILCYSGASEHMIYTHIS